MLKKLTLLFIILTLLFQTSFSYGQETDPEPLDSPPPPSEVTETDTETECEFDGNFSRPGGSCANRVPYVHEDISTYSVSCLVPPEVNLSYSHCGLEDLNGLLTRFQDQDYINMSLVVDFRNAELGGLGPNSNAWGNNSLDQLARVYPYNALADKPLFMGNQPKESFRTWWRLQSLKTQLNAKATFFNRFQRSNSFSNKFINLLGFNTLPPIFDSEFPVGSEPTLEEDADPEALAEYMNAIIKGTASTKNLRLLSPAFNLTNPATKGIVEGMVEAKANFSGLDGFAANTYTINNRNALDYYNDFLKGFVSGYSKTTFFTEFGDFGTFKSPGTQPNDPAIIQNMRTEFQKASSDPSIAAVLYFNAMNNNPEFTGHYLSGLEYQSIINGSALAGINSATPINASPGGFPESICSYYPGGCPKNGGYTLEIAFNESDADGAIIAINNAHAKKMIPIIRVCAGDECAFSEPQKYIDFLTKIDNGVNGVWYAIAGPNEPDLETWVKKGSDLKVEDAETYKISQLISELPSCLTSFPTCKNAETVYKELDEKLRAKYDSFQPFNFDNVRGYLALAYIDPGLYIDEHPSGGKSGGVIAENLPYIQALKDILSDPLSGVLNTISPDWLNTKRDNNQYTQNNYSITYSENGVKPDLKSESSNYFTQIIETRAKEIWGEETACTQLNDKEPTLPSPFTNPDRLPVTGGYADVPGIQTQESLDQSLLVPVVVEIQYGTPIVSYSSTGKGYDCDYDEGEHGSAGGLNLCQWNGTGCPPKVTAHQMGTDNRDIPLPVRSSYGRSIVVLTNPLATQVSRLISGPKSNEPLPLVNNPIDKTGNFDQSLYSLLLPKSLRSQTSFTATDEKPMYGESTSYSSFGGNAEGLTHSGKAGSTGESTSNVPRKGGQAEIDLCDFRNFWLRPLGLQSGVPSDCQNLSEYINKGPNDTTLPPSSNMCKIDNANINSRAIQGLINTAARWANIPLDILVSVVKKEAGCTDNPSDPTTLCNISDTEVETYGYLDEGVEFPRNCPTGGSDSDVDGRSKGPLQFYHYTDSNWGDWRNAVNLATSSNRQTNVCNIKDSIYAVAWALSAGKNSCPQEGYNVQGSSGTWTLENKQNAVSFWAAGCSHFRCSHDYSDFYCRDIQNYEGAVCK